MEAWRIKLREKIKGDMGYQILFFLSRNIIASGIVRLFIGNNLSRLAILNNTDKHKTEGHNYTEHYQFHFHKIKNQKLNILEIGIGGYKRADRGGCSLRMWKSYFSKSKIFGIDIYDKSPHDENRIKTFKGSQIDKEFLENVLTTIGQPLDIIIDDGSHVNAHVIETFKILFPKLKNGGFYVVEDTETSYKEDYGGHSENINFKGTSMNFFKTFPDIINRQDIKNYNFSNESFYDGIKAIHFYRNLIFIKKKE